MGKKVNFGIIAHVDSGKTTLSEAMLYLSKTIRKFGRVDKGESFLDGGEIERRRGITITSKQARFDFGGSTFTLLDTPGHSDFSAEMERTLQVMDYCVLLISATDGLRGQTQVLWNLLKEYEIPTFIFFNKMDLCQTDRMGLMLDARSVLSDQIVDASDMSLDAFYDQVAMCSEDAMNEYLEKGNVSEDTLTDMIANRQIFPAFFGSALSMEGVDDLLNALDSLTLEVDYPLEFGARVYKIMRDKSDGRLTLLKITGGELKTKDLLPDGSEQSKVNQIRLYNGDKYTTVSEVAAGDICAIEGLKNSYAGQGFGIEAGSIIPVLMPVLSYRVIFEPGTDPSRVLPQFRLLEEESPELSVSWDEEHSDIYVSVMGEVQLEIITEEVQKRFGLNITFDTGRVLYAETISKPVIGVGHFEPLRHYAEVQLLLEPLPLGSGLEFETKVSFDNLAKNWQRLILTHLYEKEHRGVLTGAPITDMRITLIGGRAHIKHTEGGDFRQATYRAIRQGLMMTESVLLEPYYRFSMTIPAENIGRAMTDLGNMNGDFSSPIQSTDGLLATIEGRVPVSAFADYPKTIAAYTGGRGSISLTPDGYGICHNMIEVVEKRGYDPTADLRNTPDSVFCSHGAGVVVPYSEVYAHKHVPFAVSISEDGVIEDAVEEDISLIASTEDVSTASRNSSEDEVWLGTDEIDAIIAGISRSGITHSHKKPGWKRRSGTRVSSSVSTSKNTSSKTYVFEASSAEYILIDGYNVIFAWDDLNELSKVNIDSARGALLDVLCDYQGMVGCELIAVFDAYRVKGHDTEYFDYKNIHVVFTAEAETADQYIERFAHVHGTKHRVTVVTSDGLEQIIIRGEHCALISSREFKLHIEDKKKQFRETYNIN